jgi:hypothetical protein
MRIAVLSVVLCYLVTPALAEPTDSTSLGRLPPRDGTTTTTNADGITTTIVRTDGIVERITTVYPWGWTLHQDADGSIITEYQGTRSYYGPDGEITIWYFDGSIETKSVDGTWTLSQGAERWILKPGQLNWEPLPPTERPIEHFNLPEKLPPGP